jgi:hypothetical protein
MWDKENIKVCPLVIGDYFSIVGEERKELLLKLIKNMNNFEMNILNIKFYNDYYLIHWVK